MNNLKRTWVLIRGVAHERAHWRKFASLIEKAYPSDRFIYIDLLGTGVHHKTFAPRTLKPYLEAARKDALKESDPPYTIMSISMGSMVAYAWDQLYPDEVQAMIFCNTSFNNFSPFYKRLRYQIWPLFIQALQAKDRVAREEYILKFISKEDYDRKKVAKERAEIFKKRPVKDANILNQLLACAKFSANKPPKAPTLIISSLGDELCDPEISEKIAKTWNLPHAIHPWGGHDLTLDDPEWIVQEISSWLASYCP